MSAVTEIEKKGKNGGINEKYYYSLSSKKYNVKKLVCNDKYKLVKLGDMCEINPKSKINKDKYKYVQIKDINYNTINSFDEKKRNELPQNAKNIALEGDILISTVRPKKSKCIFINNKYIDIENYIFSSAIAILRCENKYNKYIYLLILNIANTFEKELCSGSSYPRFNANTLESIQIPIPKTDKLLNKWTNKISEIKYNETEYNKILKELEQDIDLKTEDNLIDVENDQLIDIESGDDLNEDIKLSKNKQKKKPLIELDDESDIEIKPKKVNKKNKIVSKN